MTRRTRLAAAGVCTVVVAAAGVWAAAQGQTSRATMVLSVTGTACAKTLVGNDPDPQARDRIRARRSGVIRWTVINAGCTGDVTVMIGDWVVKSTGAPAQIVSGNSSCTAREDGQCQITLNVNPNAPFNTYAYSVYLNGVRHDPDVIIEQ